MPKIVLIDKHIRNRQGHHLEYCLRAIEAFSAAGWDSVIVANQEFRENIPGIRIIPALKFASSATKIRSPKSIAKALLGRISKFRSACEIKFIYSPMGKILAIAFDAVGEFIANNAKKKGAIRRPVPEQSKPNASSLDSSDLRDKLKKYRIIHLGTLYCMAAIGFFVTVLQKILRMASARSAYKNLLPVLRKLGITPDDILVFTTFTTSDIEDLMLIARTAVKAPLSCHSWNLVFREPLFLGEMRQLQSTSHHRLLRAAITRLAHTKINIRYWVDTSELARQYNTLSVAKFRILPILLPEAIARIAEKKARRPAPQIPLFGYIGDARQEKGYGLLPGMIEHLNDGSMGEKRASFLIQSNFNVAGGYPLTRAARLKLLFQSNLGVELIDATMNSEEYLTTLEKLDVVLLPYRHSAYSIGSSGILIEALTSGTPVVATENTWGGRQIRESAAYIAHIENFIHTHAVPSIRGSGQPHHEAHFGSEKQNVTLPSGITHLAISVTLGLRDVGDACSIEVEQFDPNGNSLGAKRHYYSARAGRASAIWEVSGETARVAMDIRRLNLEVTTSDSKIEVFFCRADSASTPLGVIGALIDEPKDLVEDVKDFTRGVREMTRHFGHYRATALEHAKFWSERHSGPAFVRCMTTGYSLTDQDSGQSEPDVLIQLQAANQ